LLGLEASDIEKALLRMEAAGTVLRGKFTSAAERATVDLRPTVTSDSAQGGQPIAAVSASSGIQPEIEWCERRLLARIHRLTVGMLRKQIEPVTAAQFMRWLMRWQHVAPASQVSGERGVLEVLRQLQGFEIPANAWERQVLARRVSDYDPKWLDQLCLTGAVGWGRLSPHPATLESGGIDPSNGGRQRRVIPTSVAPITFFVREEADWMGLAPNPHTFQASARALSPGRPGLRHEDDLTD
jgi:ATP-dependent Lhr-like helicase